MVNKYFLPPGRVGAQFSPPGRVGKQLFSSLEGWGIYFPHPGKVGNQSNLP